MAKIIKDFKVTSFENLQLNFISEIKQKIRQAQYEAMRSVNVQLINLCWEIGESKNVLIHHIQEQSYEKISCM